MTKLTLHYIGVDFWSRPVFEDKDGNLFKDINCGDGELSLYSVCGDFEGEPNARIKQIDVEIIGMDDLPTPEEKFRYQMLSRLKIDCEYYLGNGDRSVKHLWAESEEEQIAEMKKFYNEFSEDKKPEWLTWNDILNYEKLMLGCGIGL